MCSSLLPPSIETKTRDREKFTFPVKRKLFEETVNIPGVGSFSNLSMEDQQLDALHIPRKLRLRTKESNHFQFHPEFVKEVGKKRIKEFMEVNQAFYLTVPMRDQMNFIGDQLTQFGYTLMDFQPLRRSVFDRWELIKQQLQQQLVKIK
jgi:hypothetical protein